MLKGAIQKMTNIIIDRASINDIDTIYNIASKAFSNTTGDQYFSKELLAAILKYEKSFNFVAKINGNIVGFSLSAQTSTLNNANNKKRICSLLWAAIHPDFAHKGLGKSLVIHTINSAISHGVKIFHAITLIDNIPMHKILNLIGFSNEIRYFSYVYIKDLKRWVKKYDTRFNCLDNLDIMIKIANFSDYRKIVSLVPYARGFFTDNYVNTFYDYEYFRDLILGVNGNFVLLALNKKNNEIVGVCHLQTSWYHLKLGKNAWLVDFIVKGEKLSDRLSVGMLLLRKIIELIDKKVDVVSFSYPSSSSYFVSYTLGIDSSNGFTKLPVLEWHYEV